MIFPSAELAARLAGLEAIVHRYVSGDGTQDDLSQASSMAEHLLCRTDLLQSAVRRELSAACVADFRALVAASSLSGQPWRCFRLLRNLKRLRLSLTRQNIKSQRCSHLEDIETRQQIPMVQSELEPTCECIAAIQNVQDGQDEAIDDEPDGELLGIFMEEGRDLLPQVGEHLHQLQRTPDNPELFRRLLRPLHTLKGSARMAGAMRFGKHIHDLESRIGEILRNGQASANVIDELLARYDTSLQLFESLRHGTASGAASASPVNSVPEQAMQACRMRCIDPSQLVPQVRVRAGVLDRLLNQVGEISISRFDMETQVGLLRDHLTALGENVTRLGSLLRETKIHAEIGIAAADKAQPQDRFGDPLQVDRQTQLQELTQMLAESVDDVGSLKKNLLDTVSHTQNSLMQQGRLNREMQRELMQVRMVQFKELEERLRRLVRQLAKETGKELQLQIVGGAVELDRSILEKMAGPLEHLLRNAVAHGIEAAPQRRAAGKDVAGQLLLEIRQEGNEAMIRLSDDGKGLDLTRIKENMIERDMISEGEGISDVELMSAIFHPGFTTHGDVTAIAGRGVGLDVVRSEVMSSGGRVGVNTVAGRGVQFTIHLPLSLAVAQVLLFELGEQIYAIPSLLMAQVVLIKRTEQHELFCSGMLKWQNRKLPVHSLSALLGHECDVPQRETLPVLLVKNDHDVLAILVDQVIGNREVVTKSIGPQQPHMIGVVGATVLGSGNIVLILNPIQLVPHHVRQKNLRHSAPHFTDVSKGKKTVLVVDDSLTVRRVMHRLLSREGYHVELAVDGVDALHQLQRRVPDMVIVDIEMPRMDGFDLVRNIRNSVDAATLPVIVITSRTSARHRKRAMELGVSGYLGKPYQADVLLKMIHDLVKT